MAATMAGGRIPESLKIVFLASNQGKEVSVPPTDFSASKVFRRNRDGPSVLSKPQYKRFQTPNFGNVSPQTRFHLLLKERGYFPRNYSAKRSAYYNNPTEHQLASYGSAILDVVRQNKTMDLRQMLQAGLSPNACNQHGESLLHMVCRHGKADLFRILVAFDVDLQVCDDYGRTPMHDACWASSPSFEIANCLLRADPAFLFLYDARGSLPLSYCTKPNWPAWRQFMEKRIDLFFPASAKQKNVVPFLCTLKPHCRPVPDPKICVPSSLAKSIASGAVAPYQAMASMVDEDDESTVACSCSEFESEDEEEEDEDDSSHSESDLEDYSDFDSDKEDPFQCRPRQVAAGP